MPVEGQATTQEAEDLITIQLQAAATANGNGTAGDLTGYGGFTSLEVSQTGTGTATLTIQGSYDGVTWYSCGYAQIDGVATPARSVSAIAVGATPFAHVYSLLDTYNLYRAVISATAGAIALTATLRGIPL
jgi:hypothetical protein